MTKAPEVDPGDAALLHIARGAFGFDRSERLGVAVSGGGDSMAMLHLLAAAGWSLSAVTVDHGLRPEAAAEARAVAAAAAGLGVSHDILRWEHGAITGNLQDQARQARYRLIAGWATSRGIGHVAVGHTADDQAETFLMNLAREAGIDGLSGMRPRWQRDGVTWHRPFLAQGRAALEAYLGRRGVGWFEDPSNADERFQRVRARRALAALAPLGITVPKLNGVAARLSMARQVVAAAAAEAAARIGREVAGEVILERGAFLQMPAETAWRILAGALRWVATADYPPRSAGVTRVRDAIREGRDCTLGGCRIRVGEAAVRITREPRAVAGMAVASDAVWDGRWRMAGPHAPGLELRALGADGLKHCPDWRATGAARAALVVSPAVWRGATLVAAPLAGTGGPWEAALLRPFAAMFASH